MMSRHLPATVLTTAIVSTALVPQIAHAQAASAEQASAAALQIFNQGNYKEAIVAYRAVLKDYPTSTVLSDAMFRIGYASHLVGDYDVALEFLKKAMQPPSSPDLQELCASVIPQALSAKASKEADEAKKNAGYTAALKEFDGFLQKYPNSEQTENVTYARALTAFQLGNYEDAVANLKSNLQKFAKSDSAQDSQYLLALVLATQGATVLQADTNSAAGNAKLDEAEKYLRDIIAQRKDVALMNEAQFQIGELLFNRGLLSPEEKRKTSWNKAMEAYRQVQPKEPMVKAQEIRIVGVKQRQADALKARDLPLWRRLQKLEETERTKLEAVKDKGDLTVTAKVKVGQIFFQEKAYDEARVLLRQMAKFTDDKEQQKAILYFTTLTYISQNQRESSVQGYERFKTEFKGDAMGDNLPLMVGSLFLQGTQTDPTKAIEFFKEGSQLYPKGRFVADTLNAQATALLQLRRFDEAAKAYRDFLATKPAPAQAAQAEFGLALIDKENNKVPAAIAAFKKVRDTYADLPQGEQAFFWAAYLSAQTHDPGAVAELTNFIAKHPKSEMIPTVKLTLGGALAPTDKAKAFQLFKEVADEYPKSEAAPYSYFQRAAILAGEQKNEEMVTLMKQFITTYPESPQIFYAYDTIGQNMMVTGNAAGAMATYDELVTKYPTDANAPAALLNVVQMNRQLAESQGRYLALNEEQRSTWNKGVNESILKAEKLVVDYPASKQVATALEEFLAGQKLLLSAKLKTDADVTKAFQDLSEKFADKPEAKSKVIFALASYTFEKDKAKALELMTGAYNPQLLYAPADLDLYGASLLDAGKIAESAAVYQKLAGDYPTPAGVDPTKASPQVQEAQSIAIFGIGKALQKQNKVAEAGAQFDKLKQLYPWSPKLLEANFGIAQSIWTKDPDEASKLLGGIIRAQTATVDLRANSMLLLADILDKKGEMEGAINNYIKIPTFYASATLAASEGLWKGGQLLEKQAATLPDVADPKTPKAPTKPGQLKRAIKAYSDLVANYPTSPLAAKAQERLSTLQPAKK